LESEEAVTWLLDSEVRKIFERNFGGSARLVDKAFPVVVCFLPVTLRDVLAEAIPRVEADNGVVAGSIAKCKWLKASKHWSQNQRFANTVFSVNDRSAACAMIQRGVIVEGQRYQVKKLEDLPRRCFKCQCIGHMASKCVKIHEVCPLCAGAHSSDQCKALPASYRCINCTKAKKSSNHAAWDRSCPSMAMEKKKRDARNPDSQYKYFPSKEEWTWTKKQGYEEEAGDSGVSHTAQGPAWDSRGRQPDRGWLGMRETRTLGEAAGDADGWKTVRSTRPGTQGHGRPDNRTTSTNQVASGSNVTLSQLPSQPTQRSPSGNRSVPRGRQSRLGDYWKETSNGHVCDEEAEVRRHIKNTSNMDPW
jgi:hypothetical protein